MMIAVQTEEIFVIRIRISIFDDILYPVHQDPDWQLLQSLGGAEQCDGGGGHGETGMTTQVQDDLPWWPHVYLSSAWRKQEEEFLSN